MSNATIARPHDLEIAVADDGAAHDARAVGAVVQSGKRPIHRFEVGFDRREVRKAVCGTVVVHRPSA